MAEAEDNAERAPAMPPEAGVLESVSSVRAMVRSLVVFLLLRERERREEREITAKDQK